MKLQACTKEDIGRMRAYSSTENRRILEEFAESGLDCAKVVDFAHKSAYSCTHALNASIKRYRMFSYVAVARKGEVFLIRKTDK